MVIRFGFPPFSYYLKEHDRQEKKEREEDVTSLPVYAWFFFSSECWMIIGLDDSQTLQTTRKRPSRQALETMLQARLLL